LLAEIVSLEQQLVIETQSPPSGPSTPQQDSSIGGPLAIADDPSFLDFLRVIKALGRDETRPEGIRQLLNFDERFPELNVSEAVTRIAPALGQG
jgi:hypothetical protein